MQQERRVHARVAQDQRVAIDADGLIHHRHHEVLGDVGELEHVDAGHGANVAGSEADFRTNIVRVGLNYSLGWRPW